MFAQFRSIAQIDDDALTFARRRQPLVALPATTSGRAQVLGANLIATRRPGQVAAAAINARAKPRLGLAGAAAACSRRLLRVRPAGNGATIAQSDTIGSSHANARRPQTRGDGAKAVARQINQKLAARIISRRRRRRRRDKDLSADGGAAHLYSGRPRLLQCRKLRFVRRSGKLRAASGRELSRFLAVGARVARFRFKLAKLNCVDVAVWPTDAEEDHDDTRRAAKLIARNLLSVAGGLRA